MKNIFSSLRILFTAVFVILSLLSCQKREGELKWYKGNLHTHTFWSDADAFPEYIAKWYKVHGYNFLAFTDHNILLRTPVTGQIRGNHVIIDNELWQRLPEEAIAFSSYLDLFGEKWVETQPDKDSGYLQVRLKTFAEFQNLFEEQDKFILMMGQEWYNLVNNPHDLHLYILNPDEVIPAIECSENEKVTMIREIIRMVQVYNQKTGRKVSPVLAHPLNKWCITAEMMLEAEDLRFFEVYNGHPNVNRFADEFHAGTDRIWDIVLSKRLETGKGKLLYGVAADDAHKYHSEGATPGRGWVMVRSAELSEESIHDALDKGEFYSSTGVIIKDLSYDRKHIHIEIEPQEGVEYITEYIGTLSGFDSGSKPAIDIYGNEISDASRIYSEDIGKVLLSSNDLSSSYAFQGNELYVRVRIRSSANQIDQVTGEVIGKQQAWCQPVVVAKRKPGKNKW